MIHNPYQRQIRTYREQEVESAGPVRLVILTYDAAIAACGRRELLRATRAIDSLRENLNLSQGQLALNLAALYQYCADQCRSGKWEFAAELLLELRSAWVELEKRTDGEARLGVVAAAELADQQLRFQPAAV